MKTENARRASTYRNSLGNFLASVMESVVISAPLRLDPSVRPPPR
jgi:hypothetical protein